MNALLTHFGSPIASGSFSICGSHVGSNSMPHYGSRGWFDSLHGCGSHAPLDYDSIIGQFGGGM